MTLMVAGVAFLAVYAVWHLCLAVRSGREAGRFAARARVDDVVAIPHVLWLVLIEPTAAALSRTRAVQLTPRCRTRVVVVVADRGMHDVAAGPDTHVVAVAPGTDRAAMLNRAYGLIRARVARERVRPESIVVGVIDKGACPDDGLAGQLWRAFADAKVGAVQARTLVSSGKAGAVQQYDDGVLADATGLLGNRGGVARLDVTGSFVRLSALRRLGARPWRSGAGEGSELGVRLRRLGVWVGHVPAVIVLVGALRPDGLVLQRFRRAQGHLQMWPRHDRRSSHRRTLVARLRWMLTGGAWLFSGIAVSAVLVWFGATAARLAGGSSVEDLARWQYPWWYMLPARVMSWQEPSWNQFSETLLVWLVALLAPAAVWWGARRDLTARVLVRGALLRPLLVLLWPVAFAVAAVRQFAGWRTWRTAPTRPVLTLSVPTSAATSAAAAVFVDRTGRRRRCARTFAYSTAVAGVAYLLVFAFTLVDRPVQPYDDTSIDSLFQDFPRATLTPDNEPDKLDRPDPSDTSGDEVEPPDPGESESPHPSASPDATASAGPPATASPTPVPDPSTKRNGKTPKPKPSHPGPSGPVAS